MRTEGGQKWNDFLFAGKSKFSSVSISPAHCVHVYVIYEKCVKIFIRFALLFAHIL